MIYLKPNALPNKTYSTYPEFKRTLIFWGGAAVPVVVVLIVGLVKLWKRLARRRMVAAEGSGISPNNQRGRNGHVPNLIKTG